MFGILLSARTVLTFWQFFLSIDWCMWLLLLLLSMTTCACMGASSQELRGQRRSLSFKSAGRAHSIDVYTPPDYESSQARYSALHVLHGLGQSHLSQRGYKDLLLRLEESGIQMIVVFHDGQFRSFWSDSLDREPYLEDAPRVAASTDLLNSVAHVDANFRTVPQRENRVLLGFSMGAFGAYVTSLRNTEVFAAVMPVDGGFYRDLAELTERHAFIARDVYSDNASYFERWAPFTLTEDRRDVLRNGRLDFFFINGRESFFRETTFELIKKLRDSVGVPVDSLVHFEALECGHDLVCFVASDTFTRALAWLHNYCT
ncbi:MAG: hypothetical protein MHM6MM_007965 [Cercozoa sp. M6MM]